MEEKGGKGLTHRRGGEGQLSESRFVGKEKKGGKEKNTR